MLTCREALKEDEFGNIRSSVLDLMHAARRQRLAQREQNVKLGIVRATSFFREYSFGSDILHRCVMCS